VFFQVFFKSEKQTQFFTLNNIFFKT